LARTMKGKMPHKHCAFITSHIKRTKQNKKKKKRIKLNKAYTKKEKKH